MIHCIESYLEFFAFIFIIVAWFGIEPLEFKFLTRDCVSICYNLLFLLDLAFFIKYWWRICICRVSIVTGNFRYFACIRVCWLDFLTWICKVLARISDCFRSLLFAHVSTHVNGFFRDVQRKFCSLLSRDVVLHNYEFVFGKFSLNKALLHSSTISSRLFTIFAQSSWFLDGFALYYTLLESLGN